MSKLTPFHLALPVDNIPICRKFYREIVATKKSRSSDHWVDFDLFGHQLVIHYKEKYKEQIHTNTVDGKNVPVPHFGVVLEWDTFHKFSDELTKKGVKFIIEPYIRFEGQPGEQATMFFMDPAGNALEFKSFKDFNKIFEK